MDIFMHCPFHGDYLQDNCETCVQVKRTRSTETVNVIDHNIEHLEKVISEIGYEYNEGTIFTQKQIDRIKNIASQLDQFMSELQDEDLQKYFHQVKA